MTDNNIEKTTEYKKRLPELLAPAGSPDALKAAVGAGADAVYLGMTAFNARMSAKNFTRAELCDAVAYAHERGVRVYVTLNTAVLDREMQRLIELVDFLYRSDVDALILSDLGLASVIRARYPDFELHGSTQCSGHNSDAAVFLAEHGFSLMVAARELDGKNLKKLISRSPIPIEVFVHGALCVSASGQCLMSAMVGGRSGNRGECAQPCRLPYNNRYPLSLKDNCLAGHITELIEMGVSSLKIEGRMKSPDYVSAVVSVYRRLLDEGRNANQNEIAYLARVFSRNGFTDGYFTGDMKNMNGVRTDENKAESGHIKPLYANEARNLAPISSYGRNPVSDNALPQPHYAEKAEKKQRSARFYDTRSIPEDGGFDIVYLPLDRFDGKKANGVILPPVIFDGEIAAVRERLSAAKSAGALHALVGNIGHIALARELGFALHGDFRLNITNSYSASLFSEIFDDYILSPELTLPQIRDIGGAKAVAVYGRLPLMTLEKDPGSRLLTDRRRVNFPVICEGGRFILINSVPVYMADRDAELAKAGKIGRHFIFTVEGPQEVRYVISNYEKGLPTKKEIRRIK